jgi:uncharacterized membrane protein YeaQ/YmgE (transglycosylase-associated protein family)
MDLVVRVLIGVAAGTMVELLLPSHRVSEVVLAMLIGIAGALVSNFLGRSLGWFAAGEPVSFLASVLGAVVTLLLFGILFGHKKNHRQ